ncbi:MAG: hypothetical protein AAFQ83_15715 [Bacteroidota bacterium]
MTVRKIFSIFSFLAFLIPAVYAQSDCTLQSELIFDDWNLESGTFGGLQSSYRFTEVTDGVDAIVTIVDMRNARLVSLDLGNTGAWNAFQPQVEMRTQRYGGTSAYMDFQFTFVIGGTTTPIDLGNWTATAIDIDGDDYRLREVVVFGGATAYTTESSTKLSTQILNLWGETSYAFMAKRVDTENGISVTATAHMVSMEFENAHTFYYRAGVVDNGGSSGWSDAPDRMFSLNFTPCLIESYVNPRREEIELSFPVEWLSFDATPNTQGVVLNWATAYEENNQMFVVQRSTDGVSYTDLHMLPATGNKIGVSEYSFVDRTADKGTYFYRIMQQDIDGAHSHTQIEEVVISEDRWATVHAELQGQVLKIAAQYADYARLRIVHSSGLEMYKGTVEGMYEVKDLDVSRWSEGAYWVVMITPNGHKTHATFIKR